MNHEPRTVEYVSTRSNAAAKPRPSAGKMLLRALLRRCPNCGARGIFAGYIALRERCPRCGLRLHRGENDYFIGAYLLNLVAVELIFAGLLALIFVATYPDTPWALLQWGGLVLMLAGAVLCYPFRRRSGSRPI
jgi:uncharacterized protein (DUF983 family)